MAEPLTTRRINYLYRTELAARGVRRVIAPLFACDTCATVFDRDDAAAVCAKTHHPEGSRRKDMSDLAKAKEEGRIVVAFPPEAKCLTCGHGAEHHHQTDGCVRIVAQGDECKCTAFSLEAKPEGQP